MIETKHLYSPDIAIHPGESLCDELKFLGISQIELAMRTGLSEKHISQIINGESPISPETSIKLERAIGVAADFWNNLQTNYDLMLARLNSESLLTDEIEEARNFTCYAELVRYGYVDDCHDWRKKTDNLLRFFGVNSLKYIPEYEGIEFRQAQKEFNRYALAAWLRCGDIEANKTIVEPFDKNKVKEITFKLRELTSDIEHFSDKARNLCACAGIALVYTPYFKNIKVNGAARWIGNKAVIQINNKGVYSDIFWFTMFHELGHIIKHSVKDRFIDYNGKNNTDDKEKEANNFAANILIPEKEYKKFLADRPINLQKAKNFAKEMGIGLGIVVGRLAHDKIASWKIGHFRQRLKMT